MTPILDEAQRALLAEERHALAALQELLARFEAPSEDRATLAASIHQLDELFLLVVVGEFNSGKSTLINALVGARVLEEGVTPTTDRIHVLRHGEPGRRAIDEGREEITAPAAILEQLVIVDTPGTNALERRHEAITAEFVPRSDLVLFVTSADRPFTESERAFLDRVRSWEKKLVVVVNKVDFLRLDEDVQQVEAYVEVAARRLLGFVPPVFPVAARLALEGREQGDDRLLAESRIARLERYLVETLDETERLRLKLGNPLGVGRRLAATYLEGLERREAVLAEDFSALDDLEGQLALYREDLRREFRFRLADVDNLLHELGRRGDEFFDEMVRVGRLPDLLNRSKVQSEFERRVVADMPRAVEARVQQTIDWLVAAELRQWQGVTARLEGRRAAHAERLVGAFGSFELDRQGRLAAVERVAHRTLEGYDRQAEARRLADQVQTAVAQTALVEAGALGLGAVVTVAATSQLVDVTGLLAAGTLAVFGLFILPARRQRAKRELREKMAALREKLLATLTEAFDREVEGGARRIEEAVAPYTRFVRAERQRLESARQETAAVAGELERLAREVERLAGRKRR